jgi:hypothetical protein
MSISREINSRMRAKFGGKNFFFDIRDEFLKKSKIITNIIFLLFGSILSKKQDFVTRKHFGTEKVPHYFQIFFERVWNTKNPESRSKPRPRLVCPPLVWNMSRPRPKVMFQSPDPESV